MRIISHNYRECKSINSRMYIGTLVTTKCCKMSTGYRGSGCPIIDEVVPPGTEARFTLKPNGRLNTETWLEVMIDRKADKYGPVQLRKIVVLNMSLEEAAEKLHINA